MRFSFGSWRCRCIIFVLLLTCLAAFALTLLVCLFACRRKRNDRTRRGPMQRGATLPLPSRWPSTKGCSNTCGQPHWAPPEAQAQGSTTLGDEDGPQRWFRFVLPQAKLPPSGLDQFQRQLSGSDDSGRASCYTRRTAQRYLRTADRYSARMTAAEQTAIRRRPDSCGCTTIKVERVLLSTIFHFVQRPCS